MIPLSIPVIRPPTEIANIAAKSLVLNFMLKKVPSVAECLGSVSVDSVIYEQYCLRPMHSVNSLL